MFCAIVLYSCARHDADYARQCYEDGRALREQGKAVEAMEHFIAAAQSRTDDYALLGRVYSNMANMCRQAERHDLAYHVYTLSAEQFAMSGDSLAYAYALNNMAWEQAVQGHKDSAFILVDSALTMCSSAEVESKVAESIAAAHLYAEEYDCTLLYTARMNTLYGRMLRAQAFCLMGQCDSALGYAQQVINETDNPRYLDDAYYIVIHCDSAAELSGLLAQTSSRTDVHRRLEQEKMDLTEAIVIMEQGLRKSANPMLWEVIILYGLVGIGMIAAIVYFLIMRRKTQNKTNDREKELAVVCKAMAQSSNLKKELQIDDYSAFCTNCNIRLFGIADKLQQCGLSEREVRIGVMVLIGMSYAQIADILNRAQNGIGKDKYVIAQKLGVTVKDLHKTLIAMACGNE